MNEIDNLSNLGRAPETLALSELEGYPTSRVLDKKDWILRYGIRTALGDIEVSLWRTLVKGAIARRGEWKIYEALLAWCSKRGTACEYRTVGDYALALHCDRIFEDREWPGYQEFKRLYTKISVKGGTA